jgi:hypothetical protein
MVVLNAQNAKSESDIQGDMPPLAGRYHVVCTKVDDSLEHSDNYVFDFRVLAGTMPGQEGCVAKAFFMPKDDGIPKLVRLALAVGLLRPGETGRDVDFQDAVGRQLMIGVEEYTSKKGNKGASVGNYGMDTWSLSNSEVADVPKDPRAVQYAQQNGLGGSQQAQPLPQQQMAAPSQVAPTAPPQSAPQYAAPPAAASYSQAQPYMPPQQQQQQMAPPQAPGAASADPWNNV